MPSLPNLDLQKSGDGVSCTSKKQTNKPTKKNVLDVKSNLEKCVMLIHMLLSSVWL